MCNLCNDKKVIHVDHGYGMTVSPCPQCNDNYRKAQGYEVNNHG